MGAVVVNSVAIISTNTTCIVVVAIVIVVDVDDVVSLVRSGVLFAIVILSLL